MAKRHTQIPLNTLGKIGNGRFKNWYVVVETKHVNGFMDSFEVYINEDKSFISNSMYHDWVENQSALNQLFEKKYLQVKWKEKFTRQAQVPLSLPEILQEEDGTNEEGIMINLSLNEFDDE